VSFIARRNTLLSRNPDIGFFFSIRLAPAMLRTWCEPSATTHCCCDPAPANARLLGARATPGRNSPYERSCGGGSSGVRLTLSGNAGVVGIASGALKAWSSSEIVTGDDE